MKASFNWLKTLVPELPKSPSEVAERLTSAGLEVEGMHEYGAGAEFCIVVEVKSIRPRPSKSGLRLVTVNRGAGTEPLEVICGAPNVPEPGGLVVLAPLGTHLPAKGMTIERRAIAGITSEGMLCSEQELGLSEESAGIMILPPKFAEPGAMLTRIEPSMRDTIFEIGLTPNRPDGLGHIGLAREAAALFRVPFVPPAIHPARQVQKQPLEALVTIAIEDGERCPHYGAAVLTDAKMGPSPLWMRYRLLALGVRPISSAVDITNWVMLEYGHPMHAFDLEKIRGGRIVVRRAKAGEKLRTLDGVERTLVADDLVIADGEGPLALAGVMGGETSEISASTKKILLECAYFDPPAVRRSARRHGLHTESSHRFERGIDHGDTLFATARAASLVSELASATLTCEPEIKTAKTIPPRMVSLRPSRQAQLLGTVIDRAESVDTLVRLGFEHKGGGPDEDSFVVPTHRPDVSREVDLIEEVIRVQGFEKVPTALPKARPTREHGGTEALVRRVRQSAVDLGLSEAVTYAFVSPGALARVDAPLSTVKLANPLHEGQSVMRTSLVPGLLDALVHARRHSERDVRLFTTGVVFLPKAGSKLPEERMGFAALIAGERQVYLAPPAPIDVWEVKGLAVGIVERLVKREATIRAFDKASVPKHLHPRAAGSIHLDGELVGRLGLLHPDLLDELDVPNAVGILELDVARLQEIGARPVSYTPIPRFPAATRDIALVVHERILAGEVEKAVREAAGAFAEHVALFDRFVGAGVPKDHASLAFHVVYRAKDRTLTDADVDKEHAKVLQAVQSRFGATLRA